MSGRYLLDTSVIIELFATDQAVRQQVGIAEGVFVPAVAIGELYYGAYKSARTQENVAQIERFAALNVILPCDAETARWYGMVKDQLRKKGHPLPENDIWIAALALQHNLTIATRDLHFGAVESAQVAFW